MLRTPVRTWQARSLTVNADIRGEFRAALCEPSGKFVPGFSFADCQPVRGDAVMQSVTWSGDAASLSGRALQVVIRISDGTVFALSLE